MSALAIVHSGDETTNREVLEFECGVRACAPATTAGSWRLRWVERGHRRDTTARSRAKAIARAEELVERLSQGTRTDLARAKGADLVAHYLDPARRPPRGRPWSERHREEQEAYCRRFVIPVVGRMECRRMSRADLQAVLDEAPTPSVAAHLRRCLSALVTAGLDEGYLLARQDVLRGVRRRGDESEPVEEIGRAVSAAEIPSASDVHALARAAAELTGVWWRELEVLLVAYSGLRWGERAALTADRIEAPLRRITVDRQVLETRHGLKLSAPKGRKRRITMYPARTPKGIPLAELVAQRLGELSPDALLFPSPRGRWARRSGYGRRIFRPAADAAGWPHDGDGRLCWTFHSLRHVFATWALAQPGARLEDVSRLLGHSSVRITQDVYISPDGDLYDRFYRATE
jgi:integrase